MSRSGRPSRMPSPACAGSYGATCFFARPLQRPTLQKSNRHYWRDLPTRSVMPPDWIKSSQDGKYLSMTVAGTQALIAAIPLKGCISIPGIKDGTLFQKNVRQSLGLNNAVNKGIKGTI